MRQFKSGAPARIARTFPDGKMIGALWAMGLFLAAAEPAAAGSAEAETITAHSETVLAAGGWPLLEFAPPASSELTAEAPGEGSYKLVAAGTNQSGAFVPVQPAGGSFEPAPPVGNGAAKEIAAVKGPAPAAVGTFTGKPADLAGRYSILRTGGKDSGCMLTLDDKSHGPRASFKAILAPGCSDAGMLIFDPVGWQIERGRLALVARKGHQAHLDQQPDGLWIKDPKEGAPLELKKL